MKRGQQAGHAGSKPGQSHGMVKGGFSHESGPSAMHLSPLIRRALRAPCLATGGDPATPQAAPPGPAAGRSIRRGLAILLGITALGGLAAPALATPELVLLMRHGHKSGEANNYNLSPQGFERAIALASLLPRCFGRPSRILTFYLDPISSKNARSYQTAVPLAVATGTAISIDMGSRQDSFRSGRRILSDPSLDGEIGRAHV